MSLSKLSRALNTAASITRDVNAVQKGRVRQRLTNRLIGRVVANLTRRLWQ